MHSCYHLSLSLYSLQLQPMDDKRRSSYQSISYILSQGQQVTGTIQIYCTVESVWQHLEPGRNIIALFVEIEPACTPN